MAHAPHKCLPEHAVVYVLIRPVLLNLHTLIIFLVVSQLRILYRNALLTALLALSDIRT